MDKVRNVINQLKEIPIEMISEYLMLDLDRKLHGNCITGHYSESGKCFSLDRKRNIAHCFNCGRSWDTIDLYQAVNNLDFMTAVREMSKTYLGIDLNYQSNKKAPDDGINYDFNSYTYKLKFLDIEKRLNCLKWEAQNIQITNRLDKYRDRPLDADYFTIQLLTDEFDREYLFRQYEISKQIESTRKLFNVTHRRRVRKAIRQTEKERAF